MSSRKRGHEEMEDEPASQQESSLLNRLRNMWEFSNLMQYIYIFGKAVKIDEDLTIEDLEVECSKSEPSSVLSDIGLALLKYVSSHRGLTKSIFDEYTRRQYMAKAPERNPFGEEEEPNKFDEFDVFTKIRVLVQLSQWTLINAERMRERMSETKEGEQLQWRIEEIGYDKDERYYFVLDDNRLYRRTDPPPSLPPTPRAKPKGKSKKAEAAARASKRRKVEPEESEDGADSEKLQHNGEARLTEAVDGFGGRKWECIAISLSQYQDFLESIKKSRNADEKALFRRITEEVLPVIEKAEEFHLRKKQKQEREFMNIQKLATAKRSSRLEAKHERERQEQEAAEAEQKKKADLLAAKQDQDKQKKMEEARESRMMTREQRIKEREYKRILHEEELANLSEENKKAEAGEARLSERHLKTEMEKKKKQLAELADDDDEWFFDCSKCGVHGTNLDDGSHSVACEKCNVWQHSACLNITKEDADKDDFHFICHDCHRREEDAKKPKIPSLKFHIGSSSLLTSSGKPKVVLPAADETKKRKTTEVESHLPPTKKFKPPAVPRPPEASQNGMHAVVMNGPTLSPQGQLPRSVCAGNQEESFFVKRPHTEPKQPPPGLRSPPGPPAYTNGYTHHVKKQNNYPKNGYDPHLPPQTPYAANGSVQGPQKSKPPHNVGWSARYTPPQQSQYPSAYGLPPTSNNPYANTFERQRPSSSYSTPSVPPPITHGSSLSPPQQTPATFRPEIYQTPHVNGSTPHQPLPPPIHSPVKQQSPPQPSTAKTHIHSPSSSPVAHQPSLQRNPSTSPGFSPTKLSPPRTAPPGHGITGSPAIVPPPAQLSPSPMQPQPELEGLRS